jgi:hypothetical protein
MSAEVLSDGQRHGAERAAWRPPGIGHATKSTPPRARHQDATRSTPPESMPLDYHRARAGARDLLCDGSPQSWARPLTPKWRPLGPTNASTRFETDWSHSMPFTKETDWSPNADRDTSEAQHIAGALEPGKDPGRGQPRPPQARPRHSVRRPRTSPGTHGRPRTSPRTHGRPRTSPGTHGRPRTSPRTHGRSSPASSCQRHLGTRTRATTDRSKAATASPD